MIIDCHTHWHPAHFGTTPEKWLAVLDRHSVGHAIVLPTRGLMDDTLIETDNTEIANIHEASKGRMLPFCTIKLWQEERAATELVRCIRDLRVRGIKFHPWLQGSPVNHPVMDFVCEQAAEAQIPILFHDGTPPFSLPSQIGLLARRHPKTTFILGHCGLLEFWTEAITVLQRCENVWGCICSPHPGAMNQVALHAPLERLCWGSDFGFGTSDLIDYRLGLFRSTGLDEKKVHQILEENPRRLLSLDI